METGAAVEKQKQFFHSSLQNAYWRFAQFPQAWRSQQPRGGPNQMIKVGQIKWTKPARLTLARKIAAVALTVWKKGEAFDPKKLNSTT